MVLEWRQDRPSLLQCQSTSQGNMGDSEPQTFCMRLVLVSFLLLHVHNIIETLHDQSFSLTSEDSLRDSKPSVTGYPRTKGQES